mmetsp:Transcript_27929/g.28335  ORF Transcript_27929/g.28335 Transcript_27929/m.28335 type:complete len:141 (+) Transcript_27929:304-726(+)
MVDTPRRMPRGNGEYERNTMYKHLILKVQCRTVVRNRRERMEGVGDGRKVCVSIPGSVQYAARLGEPLLRPSNRPAYQPNARCYKYTTRTVAKTPRSSTIRSGCGMLRSIDAQPASNIYILLYRCEDVINVSLVITSIEI